MNIFVGLSGGVDSAVSAALLEEQGHDVTGVFIRIYRPEFIECTWKEDRLDAMRVCAALSIPFREIDFSEEYKKEVVDSMIADYQRGITPNPDVLCNRDIKFGAFLDWALAQGADKIATGHYARIGEPNPPRLNLGGRGGYRLLRGKDASKDQSYFLYRLTRRELSKSLFPIGGMLKSEVRQKALDLNLPVAKKHDSQGLCFIGDVSIADFLARFIDLHPGHVVDQKGTVIGEHKGVALLTLGQRHGFTLTEGSPVPHYVVAIDATANRVVVSPDRNDAAVERVALRDVSWTNKAPESGSRVIVQARYREIPVGAKIATEGAQIVVEFEKRHIAPPGQSLVVYADDICLGGGIIEKAL